MKKKFINTVAAEFEIATFYLDDYFLGIKIEAIQEINRNLKITKVYHADEHIAGVINLRGDVITVIDLRRKLGLKQKNITENSRNIILDYEGNRVGLLVDKIEDIITVNEADIAPPPPNLGEIEGKYFVKVLKLKDKLLAALNIDAVLGI